MAVAPTLILARELGMVYLRTVGETRGVFMAFAASSVISIVLGRHWRIGRWMALMVLVCRSPTSTS